MKKHKKKENKIFKFMGAFAGYLLAMFCVVIFALFCSARVGWFLLLVLVGAPIVSVIWAFCASFFPEFELFSPTTLVERGKVCRIKARIKNRSILPVPELRFAVKSRGNFSIANEEYVCYTLLGEENETDIETYALFAGAADIWLVSAVVYDFFGLVGFPVRKKTADGHLAELTIGILPENRQLEQEEDWLLSARSAAFDGEEPESTVDERSAMFGGFPGYEHREYAPGDPIKRINYKLSARTGKLQVRLDEQQAVAGIALVLCTRLPGDVDREKTVKICSDALEEFAAVATHLYRLDFSVSVFLPGTESFEIKNPEDIENVRNKLAMQRFSGAEAAKIQLPPSGSLIAIMPYGEESTLAELKEFSGADNNFVTVYFSSIETGQRL